MKLAYRVLMALTLLGTGSLALAQNHGNHRGNDRGHSSHYDRGHRGGDHNRNDRRSHKSDRRYDNRHNYRHDRRPVVHYQAPRYDRRPSYGVQPHYYNPGHRGHHPRWVRGHRYYGPSYVVHNYGHYHLRPPPRGYHWVRANNDYLLVAIATGLIMDFALR